MSDPCDIRIESTLPKPWEAEHSLDDTLYEWMNRTPWLAISAAAHLLVYFVLAAIPWKSLERDDEGVIQAEYQPPVEEPFVEPEPEPEPPIERVEPTDEPVLVDSEVPDEPVANFDQISESAEGDLVFSSDAPFASDAFNPVLGIGPGAGGKLGDRGRGLGGIPQGSGLAGCLRDGLEWLARHQSIDGYWDCDGFARNSVDCSGDCGEDSEGHAQHDVGVTGLALLAFLGQGNTTIAGKHRDVVAAGIKWLREQQDLDSGLIGDRSTHEFLYDHAIATLALCEAYYGNKSPLLRRNAQAAVDFIQRARNPYGAWRYDVPPTGDNDTSVTGWMVFALAAAKDAELEVDLGAFDGALAWIDEVTDAQSGRVGYDSRGSASSRTVANGHFPRERGEAMTAVGLLCRIFIADAKGDDVAGDELLARHADLLLKTPPIWEPESSGCDMYYWYYGTYAMFQMGGRHWRAWERAMVDAVIGSQRKDGDFEGSWDPVGPWGYAGGRVYSTAIMTLCAEVYFRYPNVLGAR